MAGWPGPPLARCGSLPHRIARVSQDGSRTAKGGTETDAAPERERGRETERDRESERERDQRERQDQASIGFMLTGNDVSLSISLTIVS